MLMYLNALFVGLLILSNILGVKLFSVGDFVLPAAVVVYVVTYLVTDVIGEVYGKEIAKKTVKAGFLTQIVAMIFIMIAIALPAADGVFNKQAEFETILGGSFQVMLASLVSYLVSQNTDVWIFHKLKAKHGDNKLWLRNNLSTMTSQLLDTTVFITIAFYGLPLSAILGLIGTQYAFKLLVAVVDTPIAYVLVKLAKREKATTTTSTEMMS